jgi:hypothetical protein
MRSKAEGYHAAYEQLKDQGWIQRAMDNDGICTVKALRAGFDCADRLPFAVTSEVSRFLLRYPSFYYGLALSVVCLLGFRLPGVNYSFLESAVALWNDNRRRRKDTVLKLFERLNAKYEKDLVIGQLTDELREADRVIFDLMAQLEEFQQSPTTSQVARDLERIGEEISSLGIMDPPETTHMLRRKFQEAGA